MPNRPSAARRRLHRDRVVAMRVIQAMNYTRLGREEIVCGRLEEEQWYLGCHRAACGVCGS